jgi:hypothetical protein
VAALTVLLGISPALARPAIHAATGAKPITWLIDAQAVRYLRNDNAPGSLLKKAFSKAYVPGDPKVAGLGIPAVTYTNYWTLHHAVKTGALPGQYQAVLLDLEDWPLTPGYQQVDPGKYERLAESAVHSVRLSDGHRMAFITAPAADLVRAICKKKHISCSGGSSVRRHYLQFHIARDAGHYSDVFDIQAQDDERHVDSFKKFALAAAKQARSRNPKVKVLVGLSTDNGKQEVYGYQLIKAFNAVWGTPDIDGFWLNIPKKSKNCPSCGGPFPGPALTLLKKIYG